LLAGTFESPLDITGSQDATCASLVVVFETFLGLQGNFISPKRLENENEDDDKSELDAVSSIEEDDRDAENPFDNCFIDERWCIMSSS
jgi:hypothetical protein